MAMEFKITKQAAMDLTTVMASGTSTIFTENHHSKLFHSGNTDNVVMQSVMMTIPSDCEELHKYFGIITFKAVNKSATNHRKVPVLSVQASVNTHASVSTANTPLLNVAQLIDNQQRQLLPSTLLDEVRSTVHVCFHALEGISHKFLSSLLACLGVTSSPKHFVQIGNVLHILSKNNSPY